MVLNVMVADSTHESLETFSNSELMVDNYFDDATKVKRRFSLSPTVFLFFIKIYDQPPSRMF